MKKYIMVAITLLVLNSCTSTNDFEKAKQQLEQQGYTNVKNTGYNFFCCSDKDEFSTGFECMSKDSTIVKGCICSSLLKGITIRFE